MAQVHMDRKEQNWDLNPHGLVPKPMLLAHHAAYWESQHQYAWESTLKTRECCTHTGGCSHEVSIGGLYWMHVHKLAPWPNSNHPLSITGFPFPTGGCGAVGWRGVAGIRPIGEAKRNPKPAGFLLGLIQATSPPAPA